MNEHQLRHRVAVLKNIRHDVVMDVDGYWKWFPRWNTGGGYTQEDLFVLADLLREANRKWDEQVRRDLEVVVPAADDAPTLLVLSPGEGHDLLAGVEPEPENED